MQKISNSLGVILLRLFLGNLLFLFACTKSINNNNIANASPKEGFNRSFASSPLPSYPPVVLMNQVCITNNILYINHEGNERDSFGLYYNQNTVIQGSRIAWYGYDKLLGVGGCIFKTDKNTYIVSFTGMNASDFFDDALCAVWLGSVKKLPLMNPSFIQGSQPNMPTGSYLIVESLLGMKDPNADYPNTGILDFLQDAVLDAYQQHKPPVQIYFAGHSQASLLSLYFNAMFFSPSIYNALKSVSASEPIVYTHYFGSGVPSLMTSNMLDYISNVWAQSTSNATCPIRQVSEDVVYLDKDQIKYIVAGCNNYNFSITTKYLVKQPILLAVDANTQALYNLAKPFNYVFIPTDGYKYFNVTVVNDIVPMSDFPNVPPIIDNYKDVLNLIAAYHYHNSYLVSMGGVPIPTPIIKSIW